MQAYAQSEPSTCARTYLDDQPHYAWQCQQCGTSRLCVFAAYNADLVMRVTTGPANAPECSGFRMLGESKHVDPLTKRTIFAELRMCGIEPPILRPRLLQFVLHEFIHLLVCFTTAKRPVGCVRLPSRFMPLCLSRSQRCLPPDVMFV